MFVHPAAGARERGAASTATSRMDCTRWSGFSAAVGFGRQAARPSSVSTAHRRKEAR